MKNKYLWIIMSSLIDTLLIPAKKLTLNNNQVPRVMLLPDSTEWILGTWAKEIVKWNSNKYDFVIFPYGELKENTKLFLELLPEFDTVHCLSQTIFPHVKQILKEHEASHIELISSIHHVVKLSQVGECLSADKIMVVCRQFMEYLINEGVQKDKLFLFYNGVNTKKYFPKNKFQSKRSFGIPKGCFTIGFSAKASSDHDNRKGVDIFEAVLSKISSMKLDIHIIITGPGWEEVVQRHRGGHIQLHYFPYLPKKKMSDYYNALDVYLVTARVEGGPVPPFEAMSCGTPVISTPVGTILDFVKDGVDGLIIPIEDVQSIIVALMKLYNDREFAIRLGNEGRRTVLNHLQWEDTVSGIGRLYGSQLRRTAHKNFRSRDYLLLNKQLLKRDKQRWNIKFDLYPGWYKFLKKIGRPLRQRLGKFF